MGIKLEKGNLVGGMKTVGKLINNRVISLDTSYLKVSHVDGECWLAGFGSQHELLIKLADIKGDNQSKNIDFNYLWDLVSFMKEEIELDLTEKGVFITDNTSKTELVDLMADNTDVEDIQELIDLKKGLDKKGVTIKREKLHEVIKYLRGIQEREDREELETGIMLTKKAGYVVSDLYVAKHEYKFPIELVLDMHTIKVILDLLEKNEDEEEIKIVREDGFTWFLVGDDIYRVDGLADEVDKDYIDVINYEKEDNHISLDKDECLRMLNMAKVLTDSMDPDINFSVEDGKGRIFMETMDGDLVDSKFNANGCGDIEFTASVEDLVGVISNLPSKAGDKLEFDVTEEVEFFHLTYGSKEEDFEGECIFSINTDLD